MEGNQMMMREALEFVAHMDNNGYTSFDVYDAIRKAKAALSAPPRNCDMPKPEERYREFCSRYQSCSTCPHDWTLNGLRCDGKWLLAPAEKCGAL